MAGVFLIKSPENLYDRLNRKLVAFNAHPSDDGIFDVLFPLYHLREWICPKGKERIQKHDRGKSREEILYSNLHFLNEYKIIRDLCNNAKHFQIVCDRDYTTFEGLRAGYGCAGDALNITHYVVDGMEIRRIFAIVFNVYKSYFESKDNSKPKPDLTEQ